MLVHRTKVEVWTAWTRLSLILTHNACLPNGASISDLAKERFNRCIRSRSSPTVKSINPGVMLVRCKEGKRNTLMNILKYQLTSFSLTIFKDSSFISALRLPRERS